MGIEPMTFRKPCGEVMASIPIGDLDFFFVPRSCHVDYFNFHIFNSELKIHHLYTFITTAKPFITYSDKDLISH